MQQLISHEKWSFDLRNLRGELRHSEPLAHHTSWRVGGPAEWFYKPADREDLIHLLQQLPSEMPLFWLGLGSNLLVRDGGLPGMVILTTRCLNQLNLLNQNQLYVEAGVSCAKLARYAARHGLSGTEFLAGIPGTFGGALAMNASAWGGDTWSLVQSLETVDRQGRLYHRTPEEYQVGYRHVIGPKDEWFVAATLQLTSQNNIEENLANIQTLLKKRSETQPIGLPSCGSVFRNPPGDYAARLIEQDGWKGCRVGDACVSEKHANFIINTQSATAMQIETLILKIRDSIQKHYGVYLIPEVHIVGEISPCF